MQLENLTNDTLIITATARLASAIQTRYQEIQLARSLVTWETPKILALSTWFNTLWIEQSDHIAPGFKRISDEHNQLIWQKIIEQSEIGQSLLNSASTATQAMRAASILSQWLVKLNKEDCDNENNYAFHEWYSQYLNYCDKHQLLAADEIINHTITKIDRLSLHHNTVIFTGFDEFTPRIKSLIEKLQARGVAIETWQDPHPESNCVRIACDSSEDEVQTMAEWAKEQYDLNNYCNIACIVPNLPDVRDKIESCFMHLFHPEHFHPDTYISQPIFNLSAAKPLISYPLVKITIDILQLLQHSLPIEQVSNLVHAPYLAASEVELSSRSQLAAALFEIGKHEYTLNDLIYFAGQAKWGHYHCHCPLLIEALQPLTKFNKRKATANTWAERFINLFTTIGWPGERNPDSHEYQLISRVQQLLESFATIPEIMTFAQAIKFLNHLYQNTPFQFQSGEVNVHILGSLEASGLQFDKAWVMGLHDGIWPAAVDPNPLLPLHLQKKHNMPHASHQRELEFCKALTTRLSQLAPEIIFSYPTLDQERSLRPSMLIHTIPETDKAALALERQLSIAESIYQSHDIEYYDGETAPPLGATEKTRGGSQLFRLQASCAFRAFAEIRLQARAIAEPYDGLNALERGILLHAILENFWRKMGSSEHLIATGNDDLQNFIGELIDDALSHALRGNGRTLAKQLRALEQKRLHVIIEQYIQLEKTRTPFTVISTESRKNINFESLDINIAIDRIDKLDNGETIIIDYKSGQPSISAWFGDRPDEPQLPLYCVTSDTPIDGIVFAEIRASVVRYRGILQTPEQLPGSSAPQHEWSQMVDAWHDVLAQLANSFKSGDASIDPKANACTYCSCQTLCRIAEKENQTR